MCASARNISCVAPRCVQVQRTLTSPPPTHPTHTKDVTCHVRVCKCKKHQLRSTEMFASARNISCVAPRCVQVQRTLTSPPPHPPHPYIIIIIIIIIKSSGRSEKWPKPWGRYPCREQKQANCKDLVETLVCHQVCSVIQPINQIIFHYSHPIRLFFSNISTLRLFLTHSPRNVVVFQHKSSKP